MKNIVLVFCLSIASLVSFSQNKTLKPGETFTNQSKDTLIVLKSRVIKSLMKDAKSNDINLEKVKLYEKQLELKEKRIMLADSAATIKRLEADYWRQQLLQNDSQLETQQLENIRLIDDRNRIRQSRVYYLIAGFIGGAVLISL
ncbi:hypothetical protein ACUNWD_00025 [Sunxiuqinia sp. A32]|uniref:hypothetical protein n=1 Tax=Sunxiuqinia sp. A32 TaxID=3461496 RepID=UPI0040459374